MRLLGGLVFELKRRTRWRERAGGRLTRQKIDSEVGGLPNICNAENKKKKKT